MNYRSKLNTVQKVCDNIKVATKVVPHYFVGSNFVYARRTRQHKSFMVIYVSLAMFYIKWAGFVSAVTLGSHTSDDALSVCAYERVFQVYVLLWETWHVRVSETLFQYWGKARRYLNKRERGKGKREREIERESGRVGEGEGEWPHIGNMPWLLGSKGWWISLFAELLYRYSQRL